MKNFENGFRPHRTILHSNCMHPAEAIRISQGYPVKCSNCVFKLWTSPLRNPKGSCSIVWSGPCQEKWPGRQQCNQSEFPRLKLVRGAPQREQPRWPSAHRKCTQGWVHWLSITFARHIIPVPDRWISAPFGRLVLRPHGFSGYHGQKEKTGNWYNVQVALRLHDLHVSTCECLPKTGTRAYKILANY